MADEPHHSSEPMEASITLDQTADGEFLSLDELGKLLLHLTSQGWLIVLYAVRKILFAWRSCTHKYKSIVVLKPTTKQNLPTR